MTIAITGLRASPWQSLAGYIKQLERSCRRWQLINCSNCFTRVTTLSTCTLGVDTGVESESPPLRRVYILSHWQAQYFLTIIVEVSRLQRLYLSLLAKSSTLAHVNVFYYSCEHPYPT